MLHATEFVLNYVKTIPDFSLDALISDLLDSQIDLITYQEAGKLAHVKPETIRIWVWQGKIKKFGNGKNARVNKYELLNLFLKKKSEGETS